MDALALENRQYLVAGAVNNLDMQFQATLQPEGLVDLRVTDRDVILVRKGVTVKNVLARNYSAARTVNFTLDGQPKSLAVPRGFVAINANVNQTRLRFVNTHLETTDDLAAQRAQARELLDTLMRLQARDSLPLLLAGDFNSPASSAIPAGATYLSLIEAGLVDNSPGGFTCCFPPSLQSATVTLDERIDLILSGSSPDAPRLSLLSSELVGDQLGDRLPLLNIWPSDHAGVVARFKLVTPVSDTLAAAVVKPAVL
jgi:endonuclease/exonuclease/phosphatase family metal-dependent hydrolase